ncbi:MAG: hypothetical protein ACR2Q3_15580 [Woeseiaceae bacterium]
MKAPKSRVLLLPLAIFVLSAACSSDSEPAAEAGIAGSGDGSPVENASSSFPTAPLIDPNSAPAEVLAEIQGLSDNVIAAIVAGRPFATPSALHAAIGDLLTEDEQKLVYGRMFVKVGLNSGADEDYRLIPSTMSAGKLAHEFEEYRPYESMDQFRREMAKYVSDEEVAYLARFVTLD